MMNISARNIAKVATETGFIKDNVEKVMRLVDILELLFSSVWKNKLVLKGGTAINLLYMNLLRLSVDIDLDYTVDDRDIMLEDRKKLSDFLNNSLFQKGYSLSSASKNYYALDSFVLQYVNNAGNRDNIKIEINYLDRSHILQIQTRGIETSIVNTDVPISVLDGYELYGSKIAALIGRCKPRDVFDVYQMIKHNLLSDPDLLRKCVVFYNCIGGEANISDLDYSFLGGLKKRDFDRMLKPMLPKSEWIDEVQVIKTVRCFLEDLLCLSEKESQFVLSFQKKEYQPDLLFDNSEVVGRISNHPMALWRCRE